MSSSSNGSTKQFIEEPKSVPGYLLPPAIRLYPTLLPPPEASRYDQNFMLGYAGAQQFPRSTQNPGASHESRFMSRPKAYDRSKLDARLFLHPPTPELPRGFLQGEEDTGESLGRGKRSGGSGRSSWGGKSGGSFVWHIPRASLGCLHKGYGDAPCDECVWKYQQEYAQENINSSQQMHQDHHQHHHQQQHHHHHSDSGHQMHQDHNHLHHFDIPPSCKPDSVSMCSSINPPPTFTALDNYRPVRPPRPAPCRHCSCGIIFAITTVFSLLVLVLIAGFIIYVEMVLKHQTEKSVHRM